MTDFFYLHWHEDEMLGVGYAPDDPALDDLLAESEPVLHWRPIAFVLKGGGFADYQANNLGVRVCSEKLMGIIERARAEVDDLQWLAAAVKAHDGETRPYFVLHVPASYDVLDRKRTIFAGGDFVVRACLDVAAVARYRVFSLPGDTLRLILAGEVKDAIESAHCNGMEFSRVLTNK